MKQMKTSKIKNETFCCFSTEFYIENAEYFKKLLS